MPAAAWRRQSDPVRRAAANRPEETCIIRVGSGDVETSETPALQCASVPTPGVDVINLTEINSPTEPRRERAIYCPRTAVWRRETSGAMTCTIIGTKRVVFIIVPASRDRVFYGRVGGRGVSAAGPGEVPLRGGGGLMPNGRYIVVLRRSSYAGRGHGVT